jgi:peptidoglycan/LPS O-acetylase OafA/YrhL
MSALDFMKIRAIRLYPLYLVGLLAGALLAAALALRGWTDVSWPSIAASTALGLVMLPVPAVLSASTHNIYPFDGPAWTLFFELLANAAFALVFLRLGARVLGAILAVSAIALVFSAAHFGGLFGGYNWENFAGGFPRVFWGFFAGVLVHRLHLRRAGPGLPPWAAFAALLAILAFPATGQTRAWFDAAAALVLFPLLVAGSANSHVEGAVSRVSSWLGLLSYGVYILHVPIRDWLVVLLAVLAPGADIPGVAMFALVAGAAIGAAAILDKVYDAPVRRRLLRRPAAPSVRPMR